MEPANHTNEEDTKSYTCSLCEHIFQNYQCFWRHSKKKTACVTREKYLEQLKEKDAQIKTFEKKLRKKDNEVERLSQQLNTNRNGGNQNLTINNGYVDKSTNIDQSTNIDIGQIHNNQIIFKPLAAEQEQLGHIGDDQLLGILETASFNMVLRELVSAVYFNPLAPQNCRWCVNDQNAQYGALEYDNETNYIVSRLTGSVINNNVRNMVDKVNDAIDSLKTRHTLTPVQQRNACRIFTLIGVDLEPEQIRGIKQTAYAARSYPKGVWNAWNIREKIVPPLV